MDDARNRWRRRVVLALGSMFILTVLTGMAWYGLERAVRDDPERCSAPPAASEVQVSLGGWAEPDQCLYFDGEGVRIYSDATFAGAVTRTYSDVLRGNRAALVALVLIAGGTTVAVGWSYRRVRAA